MNIVMIALGSRGDVQPMIALGHGLKTAGHTVTILTHNEFEMFVREFDLGFHLLQGVNIKEATRSLTEHAAKTGGKNNQLVQLIRIFRLLKSTFPIIGDSCWEACQKADMMIFSLTLPGIPASVAEKLAIPYVITALQPIDMTTEFPLWTNPWSLGGSLNRLTYLFAYLVGWAAVRSTVNAWRQHRLSLPPLSRTYIARELNTSVPRLYGFSPHVVPKPKDWRECSIVTGYWFLNQANSWQPPKVLVDFLESGPPPVSIGFGSVIVDHPEESTDIIIRALNRAKQRGILLTGWGGIHQSDLPDHIIKMESAPHDWLFPRMAAVAHPGGAGVTAAGLRAGVPSIVIPFVMDQFFWGKRVYTLGVGPQPIPHKKLTVDRLAAAIHTAVTDTRMRQRAAELGEKIRQEKGVANAIDVIHQMMNTGRGPDSIQAR